MHHCYKFGEYESNIFQDIALTTFVRANARYDQYTPPTPTRLNCRVEWRRRSVLNSQLVQDGFGRKIENRICWEFIQPSWLQNMKLGHDCRRVSTHRPTQLNSTAESRRRRRCLLGYKKHNASRHTIWKKRRNYDFTFILFTYTQVVHIHMCLCSPSSINWYRLRLGSKQTHRAMH